MPSQLLERRPDIAAAERRAAAANAQIGIAMSAFYPNIRLGGSGGFESMHGGTWIQGPSALWSWARRPRSCSLTPASATPSPTPPATVMRPRPPVTGRHVLAAFNDVEDQLSGLRILERATVEQKAVASAQHSLDLSNQRYQGRRHQLSGSTDGGGHAAAEPARRRRSPDPPVCFERRAGPRAGRRMGHKPVAEIRQAFLNLGPLFDPFGVRCIW